MFPAARFHIPSLIPAPVAIATAALAIVALCWLIWSSLRARALRQRFVHALPLDDAPFLSALGAQADDRSLLLAIRNATAALCGLPPTAVHPESRMMDIRQLVQEDDGWDDAAFLESLGDQLGAELPMELDLPPPERETTFGHWALEAAMVLRAASAWGGAGQ
jgi:hypothetical protein